MAQDKDKIIPEDYEVNEQKDAINNPTSLLAKKLANKEIGPQFNIYDVLENLGLQWNTFPKKGGK